MTKPEDKIKAREASQALVAKKDYIGAAEVIARIMGQEEILVMMTYDVINDAKERMLEIFKENDDSAEAFQALEATYLLAADEIGSAENRKIVRELLCLSRGLINEAAYPALDDFLNAYHNYLVAGDGYTYKKNGELRYFPSTKALYEAVARDYGVALATHERD